MNSTVTLEGKDAKELMNIAYFQQLNRDWNNVAKSYWYDANQFRMKKDYKEMRSCVKRAKEADGFIGEQSLLIINQFSSDMRAPKERAYRGQNITDAELETFKRHVGLALEDFNKKNPIKLPLPTSKIQLLNDKNKKKKLAFFFPRRIWFKRNK